jgi:hypothetical protein
VRDGPGGQYDASKSGKLTTCSRATSTNIINGAAAKKAHKSFRIPINCRPRGQANVRPLVSDQNKHNWALTRYMEGTDLDTEGAHLLIRPLNKAVGNRGQALNTTTSTFVHCLLLRGDRSVHSCRTHSANTTTGLALGPNHLRANKDRRRIS